MRSRRLPPSTSSRISHKQVGDSKSCIKCNKIVRSWYCDSINKSNLVQRHHVAMSNPLHDLTAEKTDIAGVKLEYSKQVCQFRLLSISVIIDLRSFMVSFLMMILQAKTSPLFLCCTRYTNAKKGIKSEKKFDFQHKRLGIFSPSPEAPCPRGCSSKM